MLERVAADPASILGDDWSLSAADREQLADRRRHGVIRQQMEEAFRNGVSGLVDDVLAMIRPWGFEVGEITVPTRIMYGLTDVLVPRQHGEWLAAHVPNAEVVVDESGHLDAPDQVVERYSWLLQPA